MNKKRSQHNLIRTSLTIQEKQQLQKIAKRDSRTLSSMVTHLLRQQILQQHEAQS